MAEFAIILLDCSVKTGMVKGPERAGYRALGVSKGPVFMLREWWF